MDAPAKDRLNAPNRRKISSRQVFPQRVYCLWPDHRALSVHGGTAGGSGSCSCGWSLPCGHPSGQNTSKCPLATITGILSDSPGSGAGIGHLAGPLATQPLALCPTAGTVCHGAGLSGRHCYCYLHFPGAGRHPVGDSPPGQAPDDDCTGTDHAPRSHSGVHARVQIPAACAPAPYR